MPKPATAVRRKKPSEPVRIGKCDLLVCGVLIVLVLGVFGQTLLFSFVNYDDGGYVFDNNHVKAGLTWQGVVWGFTHIVVGNWHPLTVTAHMLNCSLFGTNPAGHHLVNLTIHALTVILLFWVLQSAFNSQWISAWIAAVFAIHPLRVESVAWVSELKDVLSAFFFVATIWGYFRYARRPFSILRYGLVVFAFAVGLLCKPMLVTVPFLLLLLDHWPLKRISENSPPAVRRRSLLEKLPLLALSLAICWITLGAQGQSVNSIESLSLPLRVENALWSYVSYCTQTFLPVHLSVFYRFPDVPPASWKTLLVLALLVGITALAWDRRRKWPWLLVGWLWFLGMLAPVIGFIQVGTQAHADRYTYLPQIGLLIIVAFLGVEILKRASQRIQPFLPALALIPVAACAVLAWVQTTYWRNSEALWSHALECDFDNPTAHQQLGAALHQAGKPVAAAPHFRRVLELKPSATAHQNLAAALDLSGDLRGANFHYRLATIWNPGLYGAWKNWGVLFAVQSDFDGAVRCFRKALAIEPDAFDTRTSLGHALGASHRFEEALVEFRQALALRPGYTSALLGLRETLKDTGQIESSIPFLERASLASSDNHTEVMCMLAEVYFQTGRKAPGRAAATEALRSAEANGNSALIASVQSRMNSLLSNFP